MIRFVTGFHFWEEVYDAMAPEEVAVFDTRTGIIYQAIWYPGSLEDEVKDYVAST